MPFADPEGTLAGSIIVASVTFLAIYTTLYPFIFNYFLQKSEAERAKRGMAYWNLFSTFMSATLLLILAALTATFAVADLSDGALTLAVLFFAAGLIVGTYNILREIATSRKFIEPYARENVRLQALDREFEKALRRKLKASMSEDEMKQAITEARAEATEEAEKAAEESGLSGRE